MKTTTLILLFLLGGAAVAGARPIYSDSTAIPAKMHLNRSDSIPDASIAVHNIGKIAMTITNYGIIGRDSDEPIEDPATGEPAPSLSYPKGYGLNYLWAGAYWVGAIAGRDTLVSTGVCDEYDVHEFWPRARIDSGAIIHRSNNDPDAPEYDSSVSQQDFIANFADTLTDVKYTGYDYYSNRLHQPLNVKIRQRSYAWGYDYAEDFVLFDNDLVNLGPNDLKNVYIGLYFDWDIGREYRYVGGDDICGFQKAVPSRYIAGLTDTINIAWAADNDGDPDPISGRYSGMFSPTAAVGVRLLRTPNDSIRFNFNWWASSYRPEDDWGPRQAGSDQDPFKSFNGYLGTPVGDMNKYYMMAHPEFDYNSTETYRDHTAEGWLPPPNNAYSISNGADIRYLLSFGPFNLKRGEVAPFTFAIIAGQDFHNQKGAYPFLDLGLNALWAGWIYDNPGVDTDGDGYKGKYHTFCLDSVLVRVDTTVINSDTTFDSLYGCVWGDTIYYAGDGIPDFKGASPPPAPKFKLYPKIDEFNHGQITIRWNGRLSEVALDQFSQQADFEGYRIYTSITGLVYDFSLVTSYDLENYDRWEYDTDYKGWLVKAPPFTLRLLKQMYGNEFDWTRYFDMDHKLVVYNGLLHKYESFFFTRHDWNESDYRDPNKFIEFSPDQPYPSTLNIDSARMFYPNEVTDEGELKYFEYEYTIKGLLPSQPYYVSVTAFDQGFPARKLRSLETDPSQNAEREFAQNSSETVQQKDLKVIVYPNPYRADGNYRERFEGWENPNASPERTRAIHFTNLPNKCTIRIFSIDGDLIREIKHDFPPGSAGSMHDTWDLISRNTMAVVSGIYYYSVESELGNQLGKIVIIK